MTNNKLQRRELLLGAAALAAGTIASQWQTKTAIAKPKFSQYPFKLGVASGDPLPESVVIWTRLAPDPLEGGGMPAESVVVQWQVATDENMRQILQQGEAIATPEFAHAVHVEVEGLQPGRWYWYRFQAGDAESPIGRTRTTAALNEALGQLTFAFASCQDWQNGYYTAHQNLAKEDVELVVFLGDYIYDGGSRTDSVRSHRTPAAVSLADYRNRYALYKTDPNLQAAHAAFPWIVTWDDHEVQNNYAGDRSSFGDSPSAFGRRRAAAYQAYYEHMPLRRDRAPQGSRLQLYRRFTFGDLAQFNILDTRQYRTQQPCGGGFKSRCQEAFAASATMMGHQQEQWLFRGLTRSAARWNILAQQTVLAQFDVDPRSRSELFNLDQWDGYVEARQRLLKFLAQRQPANPIVITGDVHSSWVHDLKLDFKNPNSPTVGTEFVGTSISSNFPKQFIPTATIAMSRNPHTKFFNGTYRGYVRCHLTRDRLVTNYRIVSTIRQPEASVRTLASFVVENGKLGVRS
ncbi:alkaline phosphatase D family protein [Chroococcidiopsis thermalis]|uniref:Alkaline phosphatase n=1 Tax=Chroococcidiopsis thermalis (strain PCC 7203) TaxID=251229 RepID=K9U6T2_CHRTP|nr:alkaline phosphatase D family protein [Chroococcidiopsis thermalis]AFY90141.1 Alkaline phosphatase [Chroococcidiopsis thermalis PCC 7203]